MTQRNSALSGSAPLDAEHFAAAASSAAPADARSLRNATVSAVIGTALEWYDFYIYATAAALIFNRLFFPALSSGAGTLAAFGTYAVGFLARPVGGVLFGRAGDLYGRKKVLVITLILMGCATMAVGFLPTYASIGMAAPALLIVLRILQGLAAGAEYGGAVTLAAESAPAGRRGFYASLPTLGVCLGTLLSAGTFFIITSAMKEADFIGYGWRIPFVLSIFAVLAGIWIRRQVNESPVFEALRKQRSVTKAPLRDMFHEAGGRFWIAFAARFAENMSGYFFQIWSLAYVTRQLAVSREIGLAGVLIGSSLGIVTIPLFGWLSDRVGRRPVYLFGSLLFGLGTFPYFWALNSRSDGLIIASIAIAIGFSNYAMLSVQGSYFNELFGARTRFTAISTVREVSAVFAGGIAPFICTALFESGGSYVPVALYAILMAAITSVGLFVSPETRGRNLSE
ncbi:MFS transporter [Paraburkholderia acidisoli]|uniref:MFS transporter n=1 Tax=Paraburkholderia acidisoli TaxID=2571748 RepID=A0A7Z2GPJ8_9BURK|nr:MFS transporter [Paraburkholderia acidisoli]QGZ65593.1 MFS transporter [Paraburkholderia acidisoli]